MVQKCIKREQNSRIDYQFRKYLLFISINVYIEMTTPFVHLNFSTDFLSFHIFI